MPWWRDRKKSPPIKYIMDTSYHILFTVEFLHEYFIDNKNRKAEVFPAKDSQLLFDNIDILYRNIDNKLVVLVRENDMQEPFINKPPNKWYRQSYSQSVFRFYLRLKDDDFFNYTHAPKKNNEIIYFSNLADNKIITPPSGDAVFYLSRRIGNQLIGHEYIPGDFVMEPSSDKTFEALKKHTSTSTAELSDPTLWQPRQLLQFVTKDDLMTYAGDYFVFTLSSAVRQATTKIFGFNFDSDTPDFSVLVETISQAFSTPVDQIKIDLHTLSPGRYKLEVEGESRVVYYDPYLAENNACGVIDIFNHLPAVSDYSFLDTDESIITKDYIIQFAARSVLWKYIRKDNKAQSITDTGGTNYVFNLSGNEFVSAIPIPLSEAPLNTLRLNLSTSDFDLYPLPNPPAKRLKAHHQDGYDYSSSEIFLNY